MEKYLRENSPSETKGTVPRTLTLLISDRVRVAIAPSGARSPICDERHSRATPVNTRCTFNARVMSRSCRACGASAPERVGLRALGNTRLGSNGERSTLNYFARRCLPRARATLESVNPVRDLESETSLRGKIPRTSKYTLFLLSLSQDAR